VKALRLITRAALAAVLLLSPPLALAQDQAESKTFVPQVGQRGKDVIWVPTPQALVDKMLALAQAKPGDYLIDLGSGDGRTVITAAKRGIRALGVEYNPEMVALAQREAEKAGVADMAKFVKADLFQTDLSQATVITMFLLPTINLKLRPKLLELKPGTRIVSNSFTMGEWQMDESAEVAEDCQTYCTALLWIVPAKVAGRWRLPQGELHLKQEFQKITGRLESGGKAEVIAAAPLRGTEIAFRAGTAQYAGQVRGDTMSLTVTSGGLVSHVDAKRVRD
jgi:precorrin-6B methylase 2